MGNSYVQIPPDSTGKKIRSQETEVDGQTVHTHYMIPADSAATPFGDANPMPIKGGFLPAGTFADEQVAVGAGVWVQIPTTPPTVAYRLKFSADILSTATWRFKGTTGGTFGHSFQPGQIVSEDLGAGKAMFVSHDAATSQNINVTKMPVT